MIDIIIIAVVITCCLCVLVLFMAVVRVALNRTLREDKKRIAALADSARLDPNLSLPTNLKLQEISSIARDEEFQPVIPPEDPLAHLTTPEQPIWKPPG